MRKGKGKRHCPWRDGGAKKKGRDNWRTYVPNSVDEYEIEEPICHIVFEFYEPYPFQCLEKIDKFMTTEGISYSMKSRGKTGFAGITKFSKYVISCSSSHSEGVSIFIDHIGGDILGA